MSTGFRAHYNKKRPEYNLDLKGICAADISMGISSDWRVGPQQYGIQTICRMLKKDRRTILKTIDELGLKTYWYGSRRVIKPRELAILKIHLNK